MTATQLFSSTFCRRAVAPVPARHCQRRARVQAVAIDSVDHSILAPLAPVVDTTWELDFFSRPVVGSDGKKLWEMILTDASGAFEHVEAIPNSMVNSRELRKRIEAVIADSPVKPATVRFFRSQMFNMITIALTGLDVQIRPSRRTYALFRIIKERETEVYPTMSGYQAALAKQPVYFMGMDMVLTDRLPDALRCEKFAFGSFPLGDVQEFFAGADQSDFFGDACLVDQDLPKDAMIPGIIVFSKRSKALAGWMSGVELAYIKAVMARQEVVLECGLNVAYRFATIDKTIKDDARTFQNGKEAVGGLHFLAVQKSEASDEVDGFWLLNEKQL
jgi:hypothetical protein